jgi:hypothetical protein
MVHKTPTPWSPFLTSDSSNQLSRIFAVTVLVIVAIATLILQNKIVGWEPGYDDVQPKHHGWVSANTLAIISKATPENYFVGYALAFRDNENRPQYEYFDRYPVFFSATFNRMLTLAGTLAEKFYLAKQIMNVIFLATLVVAFLILEKLIGNKPVSLAAVLLAFSNPYLLWYKDMVHFDQPALFGFLLLIYAIALYKLDGRKPPVYVCTFVAIALGRGYASYSILFSWLVFEALLILRAEDLTVREKLRNILMHPAFSLTVLAVIWGASLLSYNTLAEAQKRNVSILQTSILRSARYRLSLNPAFNLENEGVINWRIFAESQVNRIVQWTFPARGINFGVLGNSLVLMAIFLAIGTLIWRQSTERLIVYLLLILSGFGWLIPLRNLSAFHDYTAMYYIGIPLVFFLSIFTFLRPSRQVAYVLALLAAVLYVSALVQVKAWHEARAGDADAYTYDFENILEQIDGTGRNINMPEQIPYGPFTPGFYLSEHYLASREIADYVVTRNKKFPGTNLTPNNELIYLFKK